MAKGVKVWRGIWFAVGVAVGLILIGCFCIGVGAVKYVIVPDKNRNAYTLENSVEILADDGVQLCATIDTVGESGHKWAILVHSYKTNSNSMRAYANKYNSEGYNTLSPDNRGHGASGGKYIGMGYLDQFDIMCWIDYILQLDGQAEIVLHGVSMGASALMMLAGNDLPTNVIAIVEDCGYISAREYLTWKLKQRFNLPSFPVIPIANVAFKWAAGYYIDDASAIDGVKKSVTPILFIHGSEDTTVPVEDVYKLYDVATCRKGLYVAQGAGHGGSMRVDEATYWNEVFGFIEGE